MSLLVEEEQQQHQKQKKKPPVSHQNQWPTATFFINDHEDILIEVLKRLDPRSLALSACVCRLWSSISRQDSLWENLIITRHMALRHPSLPDSIRPVVSAMGGYRRLYTVCVRPVLHRLSRTGSRPPVWTSDEVQLSLSLFSIDCYERLDGRVGPSSSLRFLCEPVNV